MSTRRSGVHPLSLISLQVHNTAGRTHKHCRQHP